MQKITREQLVEKAVALLNDGTVSCVLGWSKGEFDYDVTPAMFNNEEELKANFVFNDFCGVNFSKYLVAKTQKCEGKILVFLKPCDTYSFNQLLTEHRFDREKVYAVGIPCEGMADVAKVKAICGDGIATIDFDGEKMAVTTLYDDAPVMISTNDVLAERCVNCKSKKHVAFDELMGDEGEILESNRFDEVEKLEAMTCVCSVGLDMIAIPGKTKATTFSTKSFIVAANFAPSAAETHSTRVRSFSIPR